MTDSEREDELGGYGIAIVGLATRVPGALNPDQFWANLVGGIESVQFYDQEELVERGVAPGLLKDPHYVRAGCPLERMEYFDPEFFGFSPKEAGILDPQHRQFYECCWEALERSGHVPRKFDGAVGVFAGSGMAAYFAMNLLTNSELMRSVGPFLLRHTGNDKDFLASRVSYCFNLKGPSISVQTACSTSAVAVHLACQSLLSEECDMALAGGVSIELPHQQGYLFKEGEILSPDGHCRPFDHRARGTVFGSGTAVVVLRRLADAIADRDHIHGVIVGSAVNNDGASKVGYLAPSVEGQAEAITEALEMAAVDADSIGLVECHGTGTPVGDPIEVAALTAAFRQSTERTDFCGLGSVKSNIGHLDTAAGTAGLIKATLAIENKTLPPSLNFEAPNPNLDLQRSPFYVNDQLRAWESGDTPRRAAVNSLGVGGTNAFIIVEEAPALPESSRSNDSHHLLTFSAKNKKSLDAYAPRLADFLEANPEIDLPDVAYTLFAGREHFAHRRVLAVADRQEAIELLQSNDARRVFTHTSDENVDSIVFMFPGGGAQYADMALGLYETEPILRKWLDTGFSILKEATGHDYKHFLFVGQQDRASVASKLQRPSVQLPLIFLVEYGLAKLWVSKGIEPDALIGHSMGENTAACLAGVFSFEDALRLVLLRGQLMDDVPAGGMLSVELPAEQLREHLSERLTIAAINSPELSVASGTKEDLAVLSQRLTELEIENKPVGIDIAAHSWLLDGILQDFSRYLHSIKLKRPEVDFISNLTGTWITEADATDPDYWVQHLRNTVQFSAGIECLLETDGRIFLEVGPGSTLGSLARQHSSAPVGRIFSSLRHPKENTRDDSHFLTVFGRLWAAGYPVSTEQLWPNQLRNRIPLPTYAFNQQPYWIEPGIPEFDIGAKAACLKLDDRSDWYQLPVWIQQGALAAPAERLTWLVFLDDAGIGEATSNYLREQGHRVIVVDEGDTYVRSDSERYTLSPESGLEGYAALVADLEASGCFPDRVLHLWLLTQDERFRPGSNFIHRNMEHGFYSLFFLARAIADADLHERKMHWLVYTNGMQQVDDEPVPYPEKATVLGPCKVLPREFQDLTCACIDMQIPITTGGKSLFARNPDASIPNKLLEMIFHETSVAPTDGVFAYRDQVRWTMQYEQVRKELLSISLPNRLTQGGVYLITGGLGGIGFELARDLAQRCSARLVLINRTPLPPREQWDTWLREHPYSDPIARSIGKVRTLEKDGAEVLVLAGDVIDRERMKTIITQVREQLGTINGVVHAAGTLNDGLVQMKNQRDIEEVFTPKVYGTLVLDELLQAVELDWFVVFSSTSTAVAPVGQIDYVAANDFLNAYAHSRNQNSKRFTLSLNWGVWNEVGMAAENAAQMGYSASKTEEEEKTHARYPLFETHSRKSHNGFDLHHFNLTLRCDQCWFLDEHRTKAGQSILPGTAYAELARAALAECGESEPFELEDLIFLAALHVPDGQSTQARIVLQQTVEGYQFQLQSIANRTTGTEVWQTHAQAGLSVGTPAITPASEITDLLARFSMQPAAPATERLITEQEAHLTFGPRWHVLRRVSHQLDEALAEVALAKQLESDLEDFHLHPGILDIATGFAMKLIEGYGDNGPAANLYVPVSYGSLKYYRPLPPALYAWVRTPIRCNVADEFVRFDATLFDPSGRTIVEVHNLTIRKLTEEVNFARPTISPGVEELVQEESSPHSELRQLSPAELAFQHNLSQGILPAEGTACFAQALQSFSRPQILISSIDLSELQDEAIASAKQLSEQSAATKFARPELDTDYVEPSDNIEKSLVGFWEELLGVDRVGTRDSFFDLGGHSLIAVRLFSKIQKSYHIDFPISVLFEAPTVAACAALIRENIGDDGTGAATPAEASEPKRRTRHRHLVPMHATRSSQLAPFFLVAGMFGNVLNLRHLAQLIGNQRPFYGLQARGLFGELEPHATFEEMAADYIAEMFTVQPQGPFLVGGFSGGGITAYEISKQLMEMGHEVSQLIFLDTPLPYNEPLSSVDRMSIHWQRFKSQGANYFKEWALNRYHWEMERLRSRMGKEDASEQSPAEFRSGAMEVAFYQALARYQIAPLEVEAKLFRPALPIEYRLSGGRTARHDRQIIMHDNGWSRYIQDLDVIEVPGDHDSMVLEPNVRILADRIRKCLDTSEQQAKPSVTQALQTTS